MRKNFNTTIDEETIATIGRLAVGGKSKGAVVDEAVALLIAPKADTHSEVNRWFRETWERLDEILQTVQTVQTVEPEYLGSGNSSTATNIARAQELRTPPAQNGFPIQCRHCGKQGRGSTKFVTICFDCKSDGHSNLPAECPVCTAGQAI